ncbi:MAG: 6,7-dimethyl-8-ribityllumazine synthase [Acidimicrobiia bacterium]
MRVAIVVGRFNREITAALLDGALKVLGDAGIEEHNVMVAWVPGAFEIPILAQRFAEHPDVDAVIALGAIIRGDTPHFDYVCNAVTSGCTQVALETGVPVIFGVLTTDNEEQARARIGGEHGHKGEEAALSAIEMVALLQTVPEA